MPRKLIIAYIYCALCIACSKNETDYAESTKIEGSWVLYNEFRNTYDSLFFFNDSVLYYYSDLGTTKTEAITYLNDSMITPNFLFSGFQIVPDTLYFNQIEENRLFLSWIPYSQSANTGIWMLVD